jgi:dTDP-4-amino-4,6-dideoxygalactose transaminase
VIPYSRQSLDQTDINAVTKVLKSNFLTQGPYVEKFENEIKKFCKVKFATAVNSATSALHLSCAALGLKRNDYVWTSPISFVASANCALYCGAKIDFIDIDFKTFNIDINILSQKLIKAKINNKLPKIVVLVHMAGVSCEMKEIKKLSNKYNFKIIEDASHCTGSKYNNLPVGNCKYSDISVLSFHPVKIITTGEGGVILTNKKSLNSKVKILRTSGIKKNLSKKKLKNKGTWFYEQQLLGYNYRMSDISAALGLSQIKKINKFVKKRNNIAKMYIESLTNYPIKKYKFVISLIYNFSK